MKLLVLALCSCAIDSDPCAGRRDLTHTAGGLALTEAEHPEGWGRAECRQCHPVWTVHVADCLDGVAVDVEALDAEDCATCHGDNGVGGGS